MNMDCTRFQTEGMRLLDGELDETEKAQYEEHVRECEICRGELAELGRIVNFTDELRLRTPDDEFWDGYWDSVYRRSERRFGFLFVIIGMVALLVYGIVRAVTSPQVTRPGRAKHPAPTLSLEDYLKQRNEGRR